MPLLMFSMPSPYSKRHCFCFMAVPVGSLCLPFFTELNPPATPWCLIAELLLSWMWSLLIFLYFLVVVRCTDPYVPAPPILTLEWLLCLTALFSVDWFDVTPFKLNISCYLGSDNTCSLSFCSVTGAIVGGFPLIIVSFLSLLLMNCGESNILLSMRLRRSGDV